MSNKTVIYRSKKYVIFGDRKSKANKAGYTKAILFKGEYYTPRGVGGQKDIKDLPFFNFVMVSANANRDLYNISLLTEHDCGFNNYYYLYEPVKSKEIVWELLGCKFYH